MEDAAVAVPALFPQHETAVLLVELDPVSEQIRDGVITLLDDAPHDLLVAKPCARVQRIGDVAFHGIALRTEIGGQHGSDPALRPRGVRFLGFAFCQDGHLAVLRRAQGEG